MSTQMRRPAPPPTRPPSLVPRWRCPPDMRIVAALLHAPAPKPCNAPLDALLARTSWLLPDARASIQLLPVPGHASATLRVVRDDLLHPHIAGNKARKLDGLLPALAAAGSTDVLTCGGLHSAHAAAVAAACASLGLRSHILYRGEQPANGLSGHALLTTLFATTTRFVSRDAYADRAQLLRSAAKALQGEGVRVATIPEGAACAGGVLGLLRAVHDWSQGALNNKRVALVVDSGTGATVWSLALAIALLNLPWRVLAVPVGGTQKDAASRNALLAAEWNAAHPELAAPSALPLQWAAAPGGRFGECTPADVAACRQLACTSGVLTDPVWTLHAYKAACELAATSSEEEVVWVHTGGAAAALEGVAQRYGAGHFAE